MMNLVAELITACNIAWQKGLMSGFSGNASLRINRDKFLVTAAGCRKGQLKADDFLVVNGEGEILSGNGVPSSESAMHLAAYESAPLCNAVLHTHPLYLQILEEKGGLNAFRNGIFWNLSLYEAKMWLPKFFIAEDSPPGTRQVGEGIRKIVNQYVGQDKTSLAHDSLNLFPMAIWMPNHGLCALGKTLEEALGITEELEHLAHIGTALI